MHINIVAIFWDLKEISKSVSGVGVWLKHITHQKEPFKVQPVVVSWLNCGTGLSPAARTGRKRKRAKMRSTGLDWEGLLVGPSGRGLSGGRGG